ncbi:hypothetical protein HOY80DRAFT_939800 [Tuber brumale]|nr:hypothetical protein HOY80DRAFT_939800 [Tuber brumale]
MVSQLFLTRCLNCHVSVIGSSFLSFSFYLAYFRIEFCYCICLFCIFSLFFYAPYSTLSNFEFQS